MDYYQGTQRRCWTFTPDELASRRLAPDPHDAAVSSDGPEQTASATGGAGGKRSRDSDGDAAPEPKRARVGADGAPSAPAAAGLTPAETRRLLRFYELDIQQACRELPMDRAVMATAVALFKRFFVARRAARVPPAAIVDAALLLAIKVEACPYTEVEPFRARLARYRGVAESELAAHEVTMLSALRYHLALFHPYRPLKELLADAIHAYIERERAVAVPADPADAGAAAGAPATSAPIAHALVPPSDPQFQQLWDALQSRAMAAVDAALTTDAPLLYSPAQVAAGCLQFACQPPPSASAAGSAGVATAGHDVRAGLADAAPATAAAFTRELLREPPASVAGFVVEWLRQRTSVAPPATAAADVQATAAAADDVQLLTPAELSARVAHVAQMLTEAVSVPPAAGGGVTVLDAAAVSDAQVLESRLLAAARAASPRDAIAAFAEERAGLLAAQRRARLEAAAREQR